MSAGAVVHALLNDQTAAGSRVYPVIMPENATLPSVVYQQISAVPTHAMGQDGPLTRVRIQVDSWGKTYAEARALAGQVTALLSRYRGSVEGTTVHDVLLDNETELYESDAQARRVMQDYTVLLTTN